ncbi:protease pro-enzyme activation domain-containing protein [Terriglobus saanensis]|uniref:Peptidase S53 propeptide n=1 Tax=Terriglobus saanensis (strain ATCC BAA-1853 / DSM 23119 / SP1PR4) TaxID=401053 RepID=E8V046_TERSS|nr:protease pro-enzyme activation domain-containing protein [Terriglobus saanensis]ADV82201.1 Peptidase S53 propeptide [Terriglobus saanensis SP1PR4]
MRYGTTLRNVIPSLFCTFFLGFGSLSALAQKPVARITAEISNEQRTPIAGSRSPHALAADDAGAVPAGTKLEGMTLIFSRTTAQEADLQALLAAQQDPTSPIYHQWLTVDQFAARFGVTDADIAKTTAWLQAQGFTVDRVSRSKDRIVFSGEAQQVASAFSPLRYYKSDGEKRYAPSADISIPTALSGIVKDVANLSNFRARPHVRLNHSQAVASPNFTSSQTSSHYLTPGDITTIYDVKAAYNAGYTGTGQSIAIMGQSAVVVSDIEKFQTAAGLPIKDPTLTLVPNTGSSTVYTGDESESDLDLEYSGGIAKGATIFFVYTGSSSNNGVFDSIAYAVDTQLATILSVSYGLCETELSASNFSSYNGVLEQAAAQGQTVIVSSGDDGSTSCNDATTLTTAQRQALVVSFPASSQYVTALGGTEFTAAAVATTNTTYWQAASGSDVISSALSYMPEMVWNDDSAANGLSSGGGGVSSMAPRPTWQTGVTGIPSGNFRLVPDISLTSSASNAGYLYCSSDTTVGITGSCSNGFRDANSVYLTVAGGTSFAAPVFAGMLAIINQKLNSTGQGNIDPTLYTLASNAANYASAFHDITVGTNACTAGTCSTAGASAYAATTGYDQATGLGSIDLYNLLTLWPTNAATATLAATTTTVSAASNTVASGVSDVITITVASGSSTVTTVPAGTLTITVDGTTTTKTLALSTAGTATYTFSSTIAGAHVIKAVYSGSAIYAASTGTATVTVGAAGSGTGSFTLGATAVNLTAGNSGTSTVTVTPAGGYTGTVAFNVTVSGSLSNACYTLNNAAITSTTAVTSALTIYTSSTACATVSSVSGSGMRKITSTGVSRLESNSLPASPSNKADIAVAGMLCLGLFGWRSRKLRLYVVLSLVTAIGFGISGCGSSGSNSTTTATTNATKGSYTLTITGTDSATSTITATTTTTLTIN